MRCMTEAAAQIKVQVDIQSNYENGRIMNHGTLPKTDGSTCHIVVKRLLLITKGASQRSGDSAVGL